MRIQLPQLQIPICQALANIVPQGRRRIGVPHYEGFSRQGPPLKPREEGCDVASVLRLRGAAHP
jgi:hypothetical protein